MAGEKNIKIMCDQFAFDVKIANLEGKGEPRKVNGKIIKMKPDGSPEFVRKNEKGEVVGFFNTKDGQPVLTNGRGYYTYDEQGDSKIPKEKAGLVVCYYETEDGELIQAHDKQKTEVFEIQKWEPLENYTDKYIINAYYSLIPSKGKSKNDHQRNLNAKSNERGMRKLYDYMITNGVVGRGVLNITSGVGLPTLAYIRPVPLDKQGNWTMEIGTFKQQKRYMWVGTAEVIEEVVIEEQEQKVPSIDEI